MVNHYKTRDEWISARRLGIGATDAGAILNKSNWSSPLQVYMDKVGELPEREDTLRFKIGRAFEPVLVRTWEEETGKKARQYDFCIHSKKDYPFLIASVDGIVLGEDAGLEIKTASEFDDSWDSDDLRDQYVLQCQHSMNVTGRSKWYLAVLHGFGKLKRYVINRDDALIKTLQEREIEFWEKNILSKTPPLASFQDADLLRDTRPDLIESVELDLADDDWARDISAQYKEAAFVAKEAKRSQDLLSNQIKQRLGEYKRGVFGEHSISWGRGLRVTKMKEEN